MDIGNILLVDVGRWVGSRKAIFSWPLSPLSHHSPPEAKAQKSQQKPWCFWRKNPGKPSPLTWKLGSRPWTKTIKKSPWARYFWMIQPAPFFNRFHHVFSIVWLCLVLRSSKVIVVDFDCPSYLFLFFCEWVENGNQSSVGPPQKKQQCATMIHYADRKW